MKYILIIFIFVSFLFSQMSIVNYDKLIDQVEEIDKNSSSISSNPNNILTQEFESGESNYNAQIEQTDEYDENDHSISSNPNNILTQEFESGESNYNEQVEQTQEGAENRISFSLE